MFDLLFRALSSLTSFALPVFASYKALEKDDISLIKPWLMYWVVMAIQMTAESYLGVFLSVLPFFHLMRFLFMLWLVLPQSQGAATIYVQHVAPFLKHHESQIDTFITESHDKIKKFSAKGVKELTEMIKVIILGWINGEKSSKDSNPESESTNAFEGTEKNTAIESNSNASSSASYVENFLLRFRYPPKSDPVDPNAPGLSDAGAKLLSSIVSGISSKGDPLTYISEQRQYLFSLIGRLDEHTKDISDKSSEEPSEASFESETEFDIVKRDEVDKVKSERDTGDTDTPAPIAVDKEVTKRGWFGWGKVEAVKAEANGSGTEESVAVTSQTLLTTTSTASTTS